METECVSVWPPWQVRRTYLYAGKCLGAHALYDGAYPIVAPVGPLDLHLQLARVKRHVILDHHHMVQCDLQAREMAGSQ